MVVTQGVAYVSCANPRDVSVQCDMGARAFSTSGTEVTYSVEACSTSTQVHSFVLEGLSGCSYDVRTAGQYALTFSVRDGAQYADVNRTLVVLPQCSLGEVTCADYACSVGGFCSTWLVFTPFPTPSSIPSGTASPQ